MSGFGKRGPAQTAQTRSMNAMPVLDDTAAYEAVVARDNRYDGTLFFAVKTTGVYCRPSCPARRPRRENVRFFDTPEQARAAGFRACLRCRPDEAGAPPAWLTEAIDRLRASETPIPLTELCAPSGLGPDQFRRRFRASTGLTPAAFFRAVRAERMTEELAAPKRITDAVYDAGFNTSSQFYREANRRLGMAPSAWKNGGAGAEISWTTVETELGPLLVAATETRGVPDRLRGNQTRSRVAIPEGEIVQSARGPRRAREGRGSSDRRRTTAPPAAARRTRYGLSGAGLGSAVPDPCGRDADVRGDRRRDRQARRSARGSVRRAAPIRSPSQSRAIEPCAAMADSAATRGGSTESARFCERKRGGPS